MRWRTWSVLDLSFQYRISSLFLTVFFPRDDLSWRTFRKMEKRSRDWTGKFLWANAWPLGGTRRDVVIASELIITRKKKRDEFLETYSGLYRYHIYIFVRSQRALIVYRPRRAPPTKRMQNVCPLKTRGGMTYSKSFDLLQFVRWSHGCVCVTSNSISVEGQRKLFLTWEKRRRDEIESLMTKRYTYISKEGGTFFLIFHTTPHILRHKSKDSGARRLCVTFARKGESKRERKKRRKITFFPGPSNVT